MDELYHYGVKRRSGRYPYGSGENPYQHEAHFLSKVSALREEGLTEKEIADYFNVSVRELRAEKTVARNRVKAQQKHDISRYVDQGLSMAEIARRMDLPESTVRYLAKDKISAKEAAFNATVETIREAVEKSDYVDVGEGVATSMGITDTRLDAALQALKDEGYVLTNIHVEQAFSPDKYTTVRVLAKPETTKADIYQNRDKIGIINDRFTDQNSADLEYYKPVKSIDSKRVEVCYAEDGGIDKDGVIEIRPGAEGLDLGESRYAQVRIAVDDTHYLKGMAVYSDDLPEGVDVRFNTNKSRANVKNDKDAMKEIKGDLNDPLEAFGTSIKKGGQSGYLNIVNEEGDWSSWSKTIASQVLSKQSTQLAKRQLDAAKLERQNEYEEIMSLTNPVVKQHMLEQYADKCDTAAVELKAAAVPRQASHVILPVTSMSPKEVYAPGYKDGETVILIRYPHGGTFEIPELRVNNSNKDAKKMIGGGGDAIGIHPDVASRLSGADFDGDTVLVIPNNDRAFKTSPAFPELQNFEPKREYAKPEASLFTESQLKEVRRRMDNKKNPEKLGDIAKEMGVDKKVLERALPVKHATAQNEMGRVSNLITDMTLQKADKEDVVKAVRYSMVVIDAEKHNLDYKQAKLDNDIVNLQKKYQPKEDGKFGGASTLISRASADKRVPEYKYSYRPNPETGKYERIETGNTYVNRKGKTIAKQTKTTQMAYADDAYELSSGTTMEAVYADYANAMKSMAAKARKESMAIETPKRDPAATKAYAKEVASLQAKIDLAVSHQPLERKAQMLASAKVSLKKAENPDMTKEQEKKHKTKALAEARASLGAKPTFDITDAEWEAIQNGAISKTQLQKVLRYTDQDKLKERAMPRDNNGLSDTQIALAKSRRDMGYTLDEVASSLGVSVNQLKSAIYQ